MYDSLVNLLQSEPVWNFIHLAVVILVTYVAKHIPFVYNFVSMIPVKINTSKLTSWIVSVLVTVAGVALKVGAINEHSWYIIPLMTAISAFAANGLYDWNKDAKAA